MITLFLWTKQRPGVGGYSLLAGALLGTTLAVTLAPGGTYLLPEPFKTLYVGLQTFVWIADLAFLLSIARQDRTTKALASWPHRNEIPDLDAYVPACLLRSCGLRLMPYPRGRGPIFRIVFFPGSCYHRPVGPHRITHQELIHRRRS
jgi:hypothetical protein